MAQHSLSQEEVDALLAGVTGEAADSGDLPEDDGSGVRPYDLSSQERIVRGRMPTLEIVNERFARNLRVGLFNFMRRNPDVSIGPVKVQKFSAFVRNVVVPANINIMHVRPLRGSGLLVCDPTLVFTVIDNLFGGAGQTPVRIEGREFSATEQRIILRLVEVISAEYAKAWSTIYPIELEYARSELHMQFANIATPSEIVVTTTFQVEFGETGGAMHMCIPYSTFEPIREILYSPLQGDQGGPDRRWVALLTQQIQAATVELAAEFAHSQATVGELMALKVGDFIELDRQPTVTAKVDGVPVFECDYGALGAHYGLRIREFLTQAAAPAPQPAAPAPAPAQPALPRP
ncbi:flagellar motor switch protein FliM [Ramlibacter alkalitolerans]|uniref:Flagellar motor switch protein FliM n=1 Tax=Ramlibacter alkalitolerans TaxID=2039631 RepID=A0ABS1JM75_9BURK|nr:flagellar motor switch protein FliM [Ramlibacter alkalitolerans]MBL0424890.1 flagellar motor switch protein FliM [Ramlibacter alkalitolerans]